MDKLKVSMSLLNSTDNIDENLSTILVFLAQAKKEGAEILFCPENSLYMRIKEGTEIPYLTEGHHAISDIKQKCKDLDINLHIGSVPYEIEGKLYNSSLFFNRHGQVDVTYSKIHLFDIQLNEDKIYRESDVFARGLKPCIIEYKGWKFGQSICYDIRFSELYYQYALAEVDVLLAPAAFLKETGKYHWHILNAARAIESQCYVLSSAQGGVHKSRIYENQSRETFGNSLCISPWGEVVSEIVSQPSIKTIELNKKQIADARYKIPMKDHRVIKNNTHSVSTFVIK